MNAASLGDASLAATDYHTALIHYTTALLTHPRSPAYYIKRSTAFSRLKPTPNLAFALSDAETAVVLARERGKRELIVSAQMRRGIVLFLMGRYADAGLLFRRVEEMIGLKGEGQGEEDKEEKLRSAMSGGGGGGGNKGVEAEVRIWSAKVKGKISAGEVGEVRIKEVPEGVKVPGEGELKAQLEMLKGGKVDVGGEGEGNGQEKKVEEQKAEEKKMKKVEASQQQAKVQPAVEKVRHEWYQSTERVVVTLYVKGVPKNKVDVEFKEDLASLQFPLPSGAEYDFTLDPLFAPINPSASKVSVLSTKIEILLCKQTAGQKWSALESTATDLKLSDRQAALNTTTTTTTTSAPAPAPAYPTSSRHGAKDWDKLASSLTAKKPKEKTKKSKTDDEGEDEAESDAESVNSDYGAADPVDGFFKKLYANADPDTRRAMMKSYVESQGTSLSTNWDEVSQGPVKVRPPSE
ncbi:hypothetical protein ASPCADRAFT_208916 [Aspergillus carbonarius ITEM 5010]|uniref:CS domain-containing protein n=1 Tax=Aspergillus carbonarius (strain ITEM 5010) TaxID=602072 RepID=A0A1R3RIW5_ASPC5|nr:hypothetical protein ASPCADRAFT_208916 [Aspergillus carbonarius ITEM 5010]